jgi:serine/threonine-protein kinase
LELSRHEFSALDRFRFAMENPQVFRMGILGPERVGRLQPCTNVCRIAKKCKPPGARRKNPNYGSNGAKAIPRRSDPLVTIGRTFLGRYEVQRLLGEGGMGRVYLARQSDLGRMVVVKVMHDHIAADEKFRERFHRETKLMARFHHPYAVTLYDASLNDPDGPCIVMEYVKGGNLETLLEKVKKMTAPRVGRIIGQLCDVLQAAHDEGIIHRDLKPANLMVVDPDTPKERIKVMDFGLAKLIDEGSSRKVTDTSVDFAVGTPSYIAPEQVRGEAMDHRGDLYSVGVIAYELLSGRVPFQGTSGMDVLLAHATEDPPTFASLGLGSWIPAPVEAVIRKCLAKDPADRQQSAREFAAEFEKALKVAKADSRHRMPGLPPEGLVDVDPDDSSDDVVLELQATPPHPTRGLSATVPGRAATKASAVLAAELKEELTPVEDQAPVVTLSGVQSWKDRANRNVVALPFSMEAWMPDTIAMMKLKGFVQDNGGEVLEGTPRLVRVRLHKARQGNVSGSWFSFSRRASGPVDLELQLHRIDPAQPNKLSIHVLFKPSHPNLLGDKEWRNRCSDIFIELRGYLMGGTVTG